MNKISTSSHSKSPRIDGSKVRLIDKPVLMNSGGDSQHRMSVTPVVLDGTICYLDIRCTCGEELRIECQYVDEEESNASTPE